MPAHRRKQSNAMLYTLIIFVGLFIAATTVAVVYYVKAEEYRIGRDDLQNDFDEFASEDEQADVGAIVGQKEGSATWLGKMVEYFDDATSMIVGGVPERTSAEVKRNSASAKFAELLKRVENHITVIDPNLTGFAQIVEELTAKLESTIESRDTLQEDLQNTLDDFEAMEQANLDAYMELLEEKEILMQDYNDVKLAYEELSEYNTQTKDEQVQTLRDQLDRERANLKSVNAELLETQARLDEAQEMKAVVQAQLALIEPGPDPNVLAYIPDGEIMSVDNNAKIAYLNKGSNDRVYEGLTLAVYDRGASISEDGQGKAEIKVYRIAETYSIARITKSEINKPILKGDIVANLIWDSQKTNEFVIAGDFDLDNDGYFDYNAAAKIQAIIEKWGGRVVNEISIKTDYLILGQQPQVLGRPTLEEIELDPTAMEVYETARNRLDLYNGLKSKAKDLWIPIFTFEKFLRTIGYTEQVGQAGAF